MKEVLEKNATTKETLIANLAKWTASDSVKGVGVKFHLICEEVPILLPPSLHHPNLWLLPVVVKLICQRFRAVEF